MNRIPIPEMVYPREVWKEIPFKSIAFGWSSFFPKSVSATESKKQRINTIPTLSIKGISGSEILKIIDKTKDPMAETNAERLVARFQKKPNKKMRI